MVCVGHSDLSVLCCQSHEDSRFFIHSPEGIVHLLDGGEGNRSWNEESCDSTGSIDTHRRYRLPLDSISNSRA